MQLPKWGRHQLLLWAPAMFLLDPLAIFLFRGGRSAAQYFGLKDLRTLGQRLAALNAVLFLCSYTLQGRHFMPAGIVVIDLLLMLFLSGGVRAMQRLESESRQRVAASQRILIAGTSDTVAGAVRQLQPLYGDGIRGVLVEDEQAFNRSLFGVPVLGSTGELGASLHANEIDLLFLCSADLKDLGSMIEAAAHFDVPVKFLPSVHDLISNKVRVSKPVGVESLRNAQRIGREPKPYVVDALRDKVVLVTGAGGSIGSELVRQVSEAPIRKLILLDQDENAVFELLQSLGKRDDVRPVIADIRDAEALRRVFAQELPNVVLHAAAYKHVPMMEANPCEAVLNNVYGTRMLAETALTYKAERFLMISSDKAVRPSSVMGATKRAAEVVIQEIARLAECDATACTEFACVRFGNVLGSRGSVLPIFLKQIEQGGPITVTHEDMTRYFMTIPQAVHLVLQASTLGSHGDIYMLDMGDPVRIMDFAREVIRHAGLTPDKDIEIRVMGSRPGEKLHEQLWREDAQVSPTPLEYIFRVHAEPLPPMFPELLTELELAAREHRPERIPELLRQMPIEYLTERAEAEPALVN